MTALLPNGSALVRGLARLAGSCPQLHRPCFASNAGSPRSGRLGQQQRPGRVLLEARGEQCRPGQLGASEHLYVLIVEERRRGEDGYGAWCLHLVELGICYLRNAVIYVTGIPETGCLIGQPWCTSGNRAPQSKGTVAA
jgi:hypothetical protein